jgi:hypothetical protein
VAIQRFTQLESGSWDRAFIPFFYRDHLGGNVYCNCLKIEENVRGASIVIDNGPADRGDNGKLTGVVWTFDDVENKGVDSRISIGGNLIGISSDAAFNDHTSSSAVINHNFENSSIELNGAVIVPGVAFMQFDGVNDIMEEHTFFETAESISASNNRILNAYMEKPSHDPGVLYYYDRYVLDTERGNSDFFLVFYDATIDKTRHLINRLSGKAPETGIITGESMVGYTRGAAIAKDRKGNVIMFGPPGFGEIDGYREIENYADNYLAYSEIKDSLKAAFKLKTESLGVSGRKHSDFVKPSAALDSSGKPYPNLDGAITFFLGDGIYEIEGDTSGIVYCAARMDGVLPKLTLRGDGVFRGTIISEGDIVVEGSPTIRFDEKLLSGILLRYPEIREFFSPGEIGETSHVRVIGVAQGINKLEKDRYRIIDWIEWQE